MKHVFIVFSIIFICFSCDKESSLTFTEKQSNYTDVAVIEMTIPEADGGANAKKINAMINRHLASQINFSDDVSKDLSLDEAIKKFESEYASFQSDFEENALVWEALFDGEVIYQSPEVTTIAITTYLNTGGAHGNSTITLFNFDPASGNVLSLDDLFSDVAAVTNIAERHFHKEVGSKEVQDYFFGDDFSLPENIGFNEDGILIIYNVYEVASYAQGITEFTIPFEDLNRYLKRQ